MKKILFMSIMLVFLSSNAFAAKMKVITTYPWITSIVSHIAGDSVKVESLAPGTMDPHTIIPKPSHIARLRNADLLIINGAQLEIGWLPALLRQANNACINPGTTGFLDLSGAVTLIEKTVLVSRSGGDVHPDGNPHYSLDPDNIPSIAHTIAARLKNLDPANATAYETGYNNFIRKWKIKNAEWKNRLAPIKGKKVIEYHKVFDYFIRYAELKLAGTIEPLPGIPPTSGHISRLDDTISEKKIDLVMQDVYNPSDAARHLSSKHNIRMVILPHDVTSVEGADDIFDLFEIIVRRLTE